MARNSAEEVLRLLLRVEGREDAERLGNAVDAMGDQFANAEPEVKGLIDELAKVARAKAAVANLKAIEEQLARNDDELRQAKNGLNALNEEFGRSDKSSAEVRVAYQQAEKAVRDLANEQLKLQRSAAGTRNTLKAAGVDTKDLAAAERQLATESANVSTKINKAAAEIRRFATEADKSETATSRVKATLASIGKLAAGAVAAGVSAMVGLFKAVIGEADQIEQSVTQLNAALEATGNAAGFTAEQLLKMADAFEGSSMFSREEIVAAQTRLLSYTDVVGEQFPAAMQIVIDQAQRLGISVEQSAEVVGKALQTPSKAMEALGRQGFKLEAGQAELLKQLEETGRMAEAQAVIMDMLTESYGGAAAAARVGTIAGMWKGLKDAVGDFLERIGNAGPVDYFRGQLQRMVDLVARLTRDGSLQRWAETIGRVLVGVGRTIENSATFVYRYTTALLTLGKAFILVKVSSFVTSLAAASIEMAKGTKSATLLGTAIRAIPVVRLAVIGGAAVALAADNLRDLGKVIAENNQHYQALQARIRTMQNDLADSAEVFNRASERLAEYRDQQVLTAEQVARLSDEERGAYAKRLEGLREYLRLQALYFDGLKGADRLNAEGIAHLDALREKLAQVTTGYSALTEGTKLAGQALSNGLTISAQKLATEMAGVIDSVKATKDRFAELFTDFDTLDVTRIGDIALAVQHVGEQSLGAGRRVREGLAAELSKLSGEQLQKFQMAANAAFVDVGRSGERAALVLRTSLQVAMDRLGASAVKSGADFTAAGKDIIATFEVVTSNALATSKQIEEAFKAALGGVRTKQEAEALGAALRLAGDTGRISIEGTERASLALQRRLRELRLELDPMADQFVALGIKSQAALNAARDSAKEAFEAIVAGARNGSAAQEDVRRAFLAYADAQRAAVADSKQWEKDQVETMLKVRAAALGLGDVLEDLGQRGADAGKAVGEKFGDAKAAIDGAADSARGLADSADGASAGLDSVADSAQRSAQEVNAGGIAFAFMTDQAREAVASAQGFDGIAIAMAKYKREIFATKEELDDFVASQRAAEAAATSATNEIAKMLETLREQRDAATLSEEQQETKRYQRELERLRELEQTAGANARAQAAELRGLAEAEHRRKLAEIKERAQAERDAAREANGSSSGSGGGMAPAPRQSQAAPASSGFGGGITININGGFDLTSADDRRKVAQLIVRDIRRETAILGGRA